MDIDRWWPRLAPATQEWLIANNGDTVPPDVLDQIAAAGGEVTPDARWVGEPDADGFHLSDAATDWVEAVANGESPGPLDPS